MRGSRRSSRRGLTLVEVLAGIALMGTLLTSAIVASGRHSRQMRVAREKQYAVKALEDYLGLWAQGEFSETGAPTQLTDRFRFETEYIYGRGSELLNLDVRRVQVFSVLSGQKLCSVEIVVPGGGN